MSRRVGSVKRQAVGACNARRMAVAVSLNIENTFNTIRWPVIVALERIAAVVVRSSVVARPLAGGR